MIKSGFLPQENKGTKAARRVVVGERRGGGEQNACVNVWMEGRGGQVNCETLM